MAGDNLRLATAFAALLYVPPDTGGAALRFVEDEWRPGFAEFVPGVRVAARYAALPGGQAALEDDWVRVQVRTGEAQVVGSGRHFTAVFVGPDEGFDVVTPGVVVEGRGFDGE
jgi:hypothetical protein